MQWLELNPTAQRAESGMAHRAELGDDSFELQRFEDAVAAYETSARRGPVRFTAWARLAEAYLSLGRVGEAMAACDRGQQIAPSAAIHHARGHALRSLGMRDQAIAEFERSLALGDGRLGSLKALLRLLAPDPDGAPLLDFCDRLEPRYRNTALARAYRAIALSRLGRVEEAAALVDLDRHVVRVLLEPPPAFGSIEVFNNTLAAEILADPPVASTSTDCEINYRPRIGPALAALRSLTREQIDSYLARRGELGLEQALPLPPTAGRLQTATTVLRREGRNRQHIHPGGYISTVYHVQVPEGLRHAGNGRGALVLGVCDEPTRGHQACWGTRRLSAVEGWLTLLPSHVFHDVEPSLADGPRISVASDLCPV